MREREGGREGGRDRGREGGRESGDIYPVGGMHILYITGHQKKH